MDVVKCNSLRRNWWSGCKRRRTTAVPLAACACHCSPAQPYHPCPLLPQVLWELLTWRHPHDDQNAYQVRAPQAGPVVVPCGLVLVFLLAFELSLQLTSG